MPPRRAAMTLAVVLYLALGVRFGRSFGANGEELAVQPIAAFTLLEANDLAAPQRDRFGASTCRAGAVHTLWLSDRPRWSVCAAGRIWPIMLSGYLGGFAFWPLGAASAALGDDLLLRRALSTAIGALSLLLLARLARESDGDDAAPWVALALATTPAFVVVHAIFFHYETAPMTLAALAALCYARDHRRGALRPQTLWCIGLLAGLAMAVNLRASLVVVAAAITAWRLRARRSGLRGVDAVIALWCALAAMSPVLLRWALDPSSIRGDRAAILVPSLRSNLARPWVILPAADDVLRWWSNIADYFSAFNGPAGFNVPAYVIASCALAWVLIEGARALWRREGSPLVAGLALTILAYWGVGAMIYATYPRNMAPLHAAFGLSLGLALQRLHRALRDRGLDARAALALCAALTLPFAFNVEQLRAASLRSTAPFNLVTERGVADHLRAHRLADSRLVVMSTFLVGVFESLGVPDTIAYAEPLFSPCRGDAGCHAERARAVLDWSGARPLRVAVLGLDQSLRPEDRPPGYDDVRAAFRAAGARVVDELHARTPSGAEGILVLRVYRGARSSASSGASARRATSR